MNLKQKFFIKLRKLWQIWRTVLFPTPTERKRKEHQQEQQLERYEKYIPNFMAKTVMLPVSWFFLSMFIYFMIFGISITEREEQINNEAQKKYQETLDKTGDVFTAYKVAQAHREQHTITNDTQALAAWNFVMKPLHLDKATNLNWLILFEGVIIGMMPTLALRHRKKIVDKMHAEKWQSISPIDKTDRKIIQNMSADSPNYFYHLTLSLTSAEKLRKYKKIATPIIQGYMTSHPKSEYNEKAMTVLKKFANSKIK